MLLMHWTSALTLNVKHATSQPEKRNMALKDIVYTASEQSVERNSTPLIVNGKIVLNWTQNHKTKKAELSTETVLLFWNK